VAFRHPLNLAREAKMKRLLQGLFGALMALVVVFPAAAQDKAATADSSTVRLLPNVLTGHWILRLPGQGGGGRLMPTEITIGDQSNPKDIKGSLKKFESPTCAIENVPFARASMQGDVFKATVPLPDSCAERAHLYFIKGTALSIELKIVNEGGTITAKGKAVNPAPGNTWSARPVELSGRF
jgi:hypothetical protein